VFLRVGDPYLSSSGLGAPPNPRVTPLCFQSLCGSDFRADARHSRVASVAAAPPGERKSVADREFPWLRADAANIDSIEDYCRASY
jgi:hypothetical protein